MGVIMQIFYSATARCFFDSEHISRPKDCVEITSQQHMELLGGQSAGFVIVPDPNGKPMLAERPEPTEAELVVQGRRWRNRELDRSDIELLKVQDGVGTGTVSDWREYRVSLRNWPEHPDFPKTISRPIAPDAN